MERMICEWDSCSMHISSFNSYCPKVPNFVYLPLKLVKTDNSVVGSRKYQRWGRNGLFCIVWLFGTLSHLLSFSKGCDKEGGCLTITTSFFMGGLPLFFTLFALPINYVLVRIFLLMFAMYVSQASSSLGYLCFGSDI